MPRAKRRNPGPRSQLLEHCVRSLQLLNFQIYEGQAHFAKAGLVPSRFVICNYPHASLYGTPGRKEGFIQADDERFILEAKWQDGSGSVDEKLPYIWMAFLASPIPNWIVVLDGLYWSKDARALKGIAWLKSQMVPTDRQFHVFTRREFFGWVKDKWSEATRLTRHTDRQGRDTYEQLQWGG